MAKESGITYEQIMSELQRQIYRPIYYLTGETDYYIDKIADYIEQNVLSEDEKDMNLTVLYGKDTSIDQVIMAAKRYPMMASHQVIIVKEAQSIGTTDNLAFYLQKPLESTILVFCHKHGKLDKRKKIASLIGKAGILYETPVLYDNQVSGWITNYVQSIGLTIDNNASNMLAEFLGTDLSRIVNEIGKLRIVMPKESTRITAEIVERNIGISKNYNAFEYCKALAEKNILKANRIVVYAAQNDKQMPIQQVVATVFNYFVTTMNYHYLRQQKVGDREIATALRIHPFVLQEYQRCANNYPFDKICMIISELRRIDAMSKGFESTNSTSNGELFKEMTYRILH